jgi:FKBP-type peptidyl-prolyl cis-trans isomerase
MNTAQRIAITTVFALSLSGLHAGDPPPLDTEAARISYALGVTTARSMEMFGTELSRDLIYRGMTDRMDGKELALSEQEARTILTDAMRAYHKRLAEERKAAAPANLKKADEFLAANGKKEGWTTTESGLQYAVVTSVDGPKPGANDVVKVHYEGSLMDGTVFDSSIKKGTPIDLSLRRVIKGWQEGLQLMTVGSKYKFAVHPRLGYGERGRPGFGGSSDIPPNALLIFEVELLEVKAKGGHPAMNHEGSTKGRARSNREGSGKK